MPPRLRDEVVQAAEYMPQEARRGGWWLSPRLVLSFAAVAVAILAAIITLEPSSLAPGDDTPSMTPRPTPTLVASEPPSPRSRGDAHLSAGEHASVTVGTIEARYRPVAEAPAVTVLSSGDRVYVVDGPIVANDAVWYRVQHPAHRNVPGFVWISFETQAEAEAALVAFEPRCPSSPIDMELFEEMTPMERVLCFGDEPITLGPVFVIAIPPGTEEVSGNPAWLAGPAPWELYTTFNWPNATTEGTLSGRTEPGTNAQLASESWMEVVGHFDHPDAVGCSRQLPEPGYVESTDLAQLWCRQQFVIVEASEVAAPPEE